MEAVGQGSLETNQLCLALFLHRFSDGLISYLPDNPLYPPFSHGDNTHLPEEIYDLVTHICRICKEITYYPEIKDRDIIEHPLQLITETAISAIKAKYPNMGNGLVKTTWINILYANQLPALIERIQSEEIE